MTYESFCGELVERFEEACRTWLDQAPGWSERSFAMLLFGYLGGSERYSRDSIGDRPALGHAELENLPGGRTLEQAMERVRVLLAEEQMGPWFLLPAIVTRIGFELDSALQNYGRGAARRREARDFFAARHAYIAQSPLFREPSPEDMRQRRIERDAWITAAEFFLHQENLFPPLAPLDVS